MAAESSLADLLPLWRTLRADGVTVLVTPALDYVGALEVTPLDVRFGGEAEIASLGESLRSFVSGVDDECTLHFLYRVTLDARAEIDGYVDAHAVASNPVLREFVESRAEFLKRQALRGVRLFLFLTRASDGASLTRGALGARMPFGSMEASAKQLHDEKLAGLATLRNALSDRLQSLKFGVRELSVEEVQRIHFELLNPTHLAKQIPGPRIEVRDTLWSEATVSREGAHLREYTEAEQLLREELQEERGYLRQESTFRRALTLKVMPEGGTKYLQAEELLRLSTRQEGELRPFPYWLATTVRIQQQRRSRFILNAQHGLVEALRNAVPFLADRSVAKQAEDAAKQGGIAALFGELNAMSSKLVTLSATLLLDGESLEQLNARTDAAVAAFGECGNSQLLLEEVSQLPAFLSMMPGAGAYQFRKKTCTSRNAADFLPLFAPWRGCAKPVSLLASPGGDVFRFDPFDKRLSPAHHGLVVADTGSGKSVSLGALTLDALATGIDAILIDNGGSWEPMTKLLGGVHLPVDIGTPLTPFRSWNEMLVREADGAPSGALDPEAIQDLVTFLELCVREEGQRGFDKLTIQMVATAVRRVYEQQFRSAPEERPLMRHFRAAIAELGKTVEHPDDRRICEDVARRLSLYVGDSMYGTFLDRPSNLRFDARLITFEMAAVSKSPITRSIAMSTVMSTITTRAASKRKGGGRTLVEVDEGHAYLGQDETAERFLERSYRVMRKFNVAMWMITQQFGDFVKAKAGDAIIGNSPIKIFLRHQSGHDVVSEYFKLSDRAHQLFTNLQMKPGRYSDLFLKYADRFATVRLALHPMAYWILTTDGDDKALIQRAMEKNAGLPRFEVLRQLALLYPQGAPKGLTLGAA